MSAAVSADAGERVPGRTGAERPELDRLRLAARVALGLEPGIFLRLRTLRPAELIFQGASAGDVRISMDADLRAAPRLGAEYLLPADPFTVTARTWADALIHESSQIPHPAPPEVPIPRRRRRKASQES